MSNPGSSHQGGSSSNRSRDDVRYNVYQAVNSWSNALDIYDSSNQNGDISRLVAQLPEEDYDDIVTEPDRLETSSSAFGGFSSRRREVGGTSSRRGDASGSSGGEHSSRSGHAGGSGRSGGSGYSTGTGRSNEVARSSGARHSCRAGLSNHAGHPKSDSGGRGVSNSATASREAGASTLKNWGCDMCPRRYGSRHGLLDHIRCVHRGPYRCRAGCQHEFTHLRGLERHENTLHTAREGASWRCLLCNCSFYHKGELTRHYVRGHPNSGYY